MRPEVDSVSLFVLGSNDVELQNIQSKKIVCCFWGGKTFTILYDIAFENVHCFVSEDASISSDNIDEFLSFVDDDERTILMGYLKFEPDATTGKKLVCVFVTCSDSGVGVEPELDSLFSTLQWIQPNCLRIVYEARNGIFATDDFYDSRLNASPDQSQDDGAITAVFIHNSSYDSVRGILYEHYEYRDDIRIKSLESQARIGRRANGGGLQRFMNKSVMQSYWNSHFYEFGSQRKESYVLKRGKSPIDKFDVESDSIL